MKNKRDFELFFTFVFIYLLLNYVFLFQLTNTFKLLYWKSKNFFSGILVIILIVSAVYSIIFILFLIYELFLPEIKIKGKNFNPITCTKENINFIIYHLFTYLLIIIIFIIFLIIIGNPIIEMVGSDFVIGYGKDIKGFVPFIIILFIFLLIRLFTKKIFINKKYNKENTYNEILFDESYQYLFKYGVSNFFIVLYLIISFILLFSYNHNIENLFYNHIILSFLLFLYSIPYMRNKGYRNIKYSLLCFIPFGFLILMFYPARDERLDDD